jgi:hypothetical protein
MPKWSVRSAGARTVGAESPEQRLASNLTRGQGSAEAGRQAGARTLNSLEGRAGLWFK